MSQVSVLMDVAPYRLSGLVYGALLNHHTGLRALGDAVQQPPYKGPPRAPVLYIKPRNTLAAAGAPVFVPADTAELEVCACLGLVIGRPACRLVPEEALDYLAGYLIVNDITVPHSSYYRPSVRFRARDGFCPLGPHVVARGAVASPDDLGIRVFVDGQLRQETSTAALVRPAAKLLADVTEFMTLSPGDVLALGFASPAPRVRAGQRAVIEIDGVGRQETPFVAAP